MNVVPYIRQDRVPRADRLQETAELANQVAGTDFVPTNLRNNPAAITAAILYGDEVGLGPMQSLAKIAVINGRPTLAAEAQRALILHAGHDLWIEETTVTKCTVAGRRRDSDNSSRVTWTMDDARKAGLAGRQSWKTYPRQMLLARASAELARAVFPDAIGGLAATEELEDNPDLTVDNGGASAATPAPKTTKRRRASVTAPATTPEAPPPTQPDLPALPGEEEPENDDDEPEPISENRRRRLHATFREKGINDRGDRLSYTEAVIGRYIDSSNKLTDAEAQTLIEHLEAYNVEDPQTWPVQHNPDGQDAF